MAKLNFNAAEGTPMEERSFELLPEGEYVASIVDSDTKPTKDNTGERLNLKFKVTQGDHKGQYIFVGLNIKNRSEVAVNISMAELKSICDAIGKGRDSISDSKELHGVPMSVLVKHSKPSGEYKDTDGSTKFKYGPRPEIKAYKKLEGEAAGSDPAPSSPPWEKE